MGVACGADAAADARVVGHEEGFVEDVDVVVRAAGEAVEGVARQADVAGVVGARVGVDVAHAAADVAVSAVADEADEQNEMGNLPRELEAAARAAAVGSVEVGACSRDG